MFCSICLKRLRNEKARLVQHKTRCELAEWLMVDNMTEQDLYLIMEAKERDPFTANAQAAGAAPVPETKPPEFLNGGLPPKEYTSFGAPADKQFFKQSTMSDESTRSELTR